jgi:DNA polymerase-4
MTVGSAPSWEATRRVAHLDMDAFYASVELLWRPELKGRPVAIGGRGDPTRRGVVTTATYEARAFGVHSGMALSRAARLCPDLIFLPVDFERYRDMSRRFKQALRQRIERIEDRGIDEVYLDLTDQTERSLDLARQLQQAVLEATGLDCSIGIGPNKLIAKIASDLNKPRGITIIGPEDVPARLWPLAARKIPGIGPRADQTLQSLGIHTIGELASTPLDTLMPSFTPRYSRWLLRVAQGDDDRPLELDPEPRSRSRETTFERDLHPRHDWESLARTLLRLCEQVSADLARRGYGGRTVGIKLRTADFRTLTRDRTLPEPVQRTGDIALLAFECLRRAAVKGPIRLLGVRVGELSPQGEGLLSPQGEGPVRSSDSGAAKPGPDLLQDPSRSRP